MITLLWIHRDNRYNYKSSAEQRILKKKIAVSDQSSPTDKSNEYPEAVYRDKHQESTEQLTGKLTKLTTMLRKPPIESTTIQATGWSVKRTSKDDYRVNATYQ